MESRAAKMTWSPVAFRRSGKLDAMIDDEVKALQRDPRPPREGTENPELELRTYGRRRGHGLSTRQRQLLADVLPRLKLDLSQPCLDAAMLVEPPSRETWLEIGFGGGEHLVWQASRHAEIGLIGCEPFIDGVVKVLDAVERAGLVNVRVHDDDARQVLRWLPPASIGRVFILFPDPWPKKRHHKRRLMAPATLGMLARVMRPGAELRFASDIAGYVRSALLAVAEEGSFEWPASTADDWRIRPDDWPQTRYEAKALAAGRRCSYFRFQRRPYGAAT